MQIQRQVASAGWQPFLPLITQAGWNGQTIYVDGGFVS